MILDDYYEIAQPASITAIHMYIALSPRISSSGIVFLSKCVCAYSLLDRMSDMHYSVYEFT